MARSTGDRSAHQEDTAVGPTRTAHRGGTGNRHRVRAWPHLDSGRLADGPEPPRWPLDERLPGPARCPAPPGWTWARWPGGPWPGPDSTEPPAGPHIPR